MTQIPETRLISLQAVTFLHPGTGQTTGVVDLPVQREVHTQFPMVAASGFKGSLRDKAERMPPGVLGHMTEAERKVIFGGDTQDAPSAGALTLTDGRILAFPVRSLQHVFVWVTCAMVLERLFRDVKLIGLNLPDKNVPDTVTDTTIGVAVVPKKSDFSDPLVLEDVALSVQEETLAEKTAALIGQLVDPEGGFDPTRLVIVSNADFKYFVRYATQVSARIRLNEYKTTTGGEGNLWYEETLPPETIFYSLVLCHRPRHENGGSIGTPEHVAEKLAGLCSDAFLQIGGNETVGQGWCRIKLTGGAS